MNQEVVSQGSKGMIFPAWWFLLSPMSAICMDTGWRGSLHGSAKPPDLYLSLALELLPHTLISRPCSCLGVSGCFGSSVWRLGAGLRIASSRHTAAARLRAGWLAMRLLLGPGASFTEEPGCQEEPGLCLPSRAWNTFGCRGNRLHISPLVKE